MKRIVFFGLALLPFFLSACGSKNALAGTWKPTEYTFAGKKKDQAYLDKTYLVFKSDGTAETSVGGRKQPATYTVKGNDVVLKLKIGGEVTHKLQGETLTISNNVTKATFKKIK
ncbi:MAG TPA: hypothetical protein ENJ97_05755 [Planctomycetes bacterium]|nr:hypothetical protein [Planctomycetota bacterium]